MSEIPADKLFDLNLSNGRKPMDLIQGFVKIVTFQTWIVIVLSLGSTYISLRYGFAVELPSELVSVAIVFPIAFSINAAYQRRENALDAFASLKSHLIAILFAHRDWLKPQDTTSHVERVKPLILKLLATLNRHFASPHDDCDLAAIYELFSEVSDSIEVLRQSGMSGSEISRVNQYLRVIMVNFEAMRNISTYRTPRALRSYSHVFLSTFPILFGPYFAYLSDESFFSCGFIVAGVYSLVLMSLDNIQLLLEDPFDKDGADDVDLNVIDDYKEVLNRCTNRNPTLTSVMLTIDP